MYFKNICDNIINKSEFSSIYKLYKLIKLVKLLWIIPKN